MTLDTVGRERFSLTVRDITSGALLDLPAEAVPLEEVGRRAWDKATAVSAASGAKETESMPRITVETAPLAATALSMLTEAAAAEGGMSSSGDVEPALHCGEQGGGRRSQASPWHCNLMPTVVWGNPRVGDSAAATLFAVVRASSGAGGSSGQQVGKYVGWDSRLQGRPRV